MMANRITSMKNLLKYYPNKRFYHVDLINMTHLSCRILLIFSTRQSIHVDSIDNGKKTEKYNLTEE